MANIGDYNIKFTFVYKDIDLYNRNQVIRKQKISGIIAFDILLIAGS